MTRVVPYKFNDPTLGVPYRQVWPKYLDDDFAFLQNQFDSLRVVNIRNFGAACDSNPLGTTGTNDTTAINAALATLIPGDILYIPGWSLISGALNLGTSGVRIVGSAAWGAGLVTTSATADIFTCTSGLSNVSFENLGFWSTVTKSAGNVFTCPDAARFLWWRVVAADRSTVAAYGNRLWRIIDLQGTDDSNILACQLSGAQTNLVRVYGNGPYISELHIGGGTRLSGCSDIGVLVAGGFGGFYLDSASVDSCRVNVRFDKSVVATSNREMFFGSTCVLDACNDTCFELGPQGASYVSMAGTWVASAGLFGTMSGINAGIFIDPSNFAIMDFTGVRVFNNVGSGIVTGGGGINLSGSIDGNGLFGVNIANSALGSFNMGSGFVSNNGSGDFNIVAGVNGYSIQGVTLGSTTKVVNATTLSANKIIKDCPGYVTELTTQQTVVLGANNVVAAHGLAGTPASVQLTPRSTPGATLWWADTLTATNATIHLTGAAAANVVFDMRASMNTVN